jgi:hypothetical protein
MGIKSTEVPVRNFSELHAELDKYRVAKRYYFRGHAHPDWKLLPKVGRPPYRGVDEKAVFLSWKRQAIEYADGRTLNDWQWLSIAQHHGLATRFLDWSSNPLNACFFALREEFNTDAYVYVAQFRWAVPDDAADPFSYPYLAILRPHRVVPRITRQGGLFSLHPIPAVELDAGHEGLLDLNRIVIPREYRNTLRSELSYYGINSATLFPDLDGLSDFCNWAIATKEYWGPPLK